MVLSPCGDSSDSDDYFFLGISGAWRSLTICICGHVQQVTTLVPTRGSLTLGYNFKKINAGKLVF